MEFFRRNRLLSFLLFCALFTVLVLRFIGPQYLRASYMLSQAVPGPTTAEPPSTGTSSAGSLSEQIDKFLGELDADAFLLWQYSGDGPNFSIGPGSTDKFSFYKGEEPCQLLQEKATQYPDKKLGVNMHALTHFHEQAKNVIPYLKGSCGTKVIRVWADGGKTIAGIKEVLRVAKDNGVEVIIVAHDFSNGVGPRHGNPTMWYKEYFTKEDTGHGKSYLDHVRQLASALKDEPNIYAFELLNEPHCKGYPECVGPYTESWARTTSLAVKNIAPKLRISLGQMANGDIGRGDSPGLGDFAKSNQYADVTSGHYYVEEDLPHVERAARISLDQLRKPFYIGEAPANLETDSKEKYFEYNIDRSTYPRVLNSFLDQYSVSCMPKAEFELTSIRAEKCSEVNKGCKGWNSRGELKLDADGKLFGLYRSQEAADKRQGTSAPLTANDRFESLEAYLSARSKEPDEKAVDAQGKVIKDISAYQAPIYKNATLEQQCEFVKKKVQAVNDLCLTANRIEEDKTKCALDKKIADEQGDTGFTHSALYDALKQNSCSSVMNQELDNEHLKKIRRAVLATNPAMEAAYRPAFIVMVTKTPGVDETKNPNYRSQKNPNPAQPIYQVDYLEIKVPSIGSDYGVAGEGRSLVTKNANISSYRDPLTLSADVLTEEDFQEQWKDLERKERKMVRAQAAERGFNTGPIVGGDQGVKCRNKDGKLVDCDEDPIIQALLTTINASNIPVIPERQKLSPYGAAWNVPCLMEEKDFYDGKEPTGADGSKNVTAESASEIGTKMDAVDVGKYKKKKSAVTELEGKVDLDEPTNSENVRTQIFFVSPHKYNLEYAQSAFKVFLELHNGEKLATSSNFPAPLKANLNEKYTNSIETSSNGRPRPTGLAIGRTPATSNGTTPSSSGGPSSSSGPEASIGPETAPTITVSVALEQKENQHPVLWRVAGNVANIPTRLFTLLGTERSSGFNRYTAGCEGEFATEDWFLGRCKAKNDAVTNRPTDTAEDELYCIDWQMPVGSPDLQKIKAELMANLKKEGYPDGYVLPHPLGTPYFEARRTKLLALNATLRVANGGYLPEGFDKLNFIENYNNGGRALLWTYHPDCNGKVCYEHIIDECIAKGFNPGVCIAMNLSESGGSNHIRWEDKGGAWDFGCITAPKQNIDAQLKCIIDDFLSKPKLNGRDYNFMFKDFAGANDLGSPSYMNVKKYYQRYAGNLFIKEGACTGSNSSGSDPTPD